MDVDEKVVAVKATRATCFRSGSYVKQPKAILSCFCREALKHYSLGCIN